MWSQNYGPEILRCNAVGRADNAMPYIIFIRQARPTLLATQLRERDTNKKTKCAGRRRRVERAVEEHTHAAYTAFQCTV